MTYIGKCCPWFLVAALAALIGLLDRKFDLLVQLAPAFILGINSNHLRATPVLVGLTAGIVVSLALVFGPFEFVVNGKIWGFHPGLFGLALNVMIAFVGSTVSRYGTASTGSSV